jgi:DNA (cytosine-5)-methyltransferase 1
VTPTHLDLFSGIGGFALSARWAGFETVQFVEIDDYCQKVLKKHWPDVPIHEDVRTFNGTVYRGRIDLLTGGFPCQDVSDAGLRAGIEGERSGLWRELHRTISEVLPRYVVVENVTGLLRRGMGRVLGDLAAIRYDAEWGVFSACQHGAPHARERVFLVAYPMRERRYRPQVLQSVNPQKLDEWGAKATQPLIKSAGRSHLQIPSRFRVCNGVSDRLDAYPTERIRGLGNAIVPQVAYPILQAIRELI